MKLRPRNKKIKKEYKEESDELSEQESEESSEQESDELSEQESDELSEQESDELSEQESDDDSQNEFDPEEIIEEDLDEKELYEEDLEEDLEKDSDEEDLEEELDEEDSEEEIDEEELTRNLLKRKSSYQEYLEDLDEEVPTKKQKMSIDYSPESLSIHINIPSETLMFFEDMIQQNFMPFEMYEEKENDNRSDMSSLVELDSLRRNVKKIEKKNDKVDEKRGAKYFVFNDDELNSIKDIKELESLKKLISILENENATDDQKKLIEALKELDSLIGMNEIKLQIIDQIMFYMQDFSSKDSFLHTVISGPPGVGKTVVAKIMAKIYVSLGFLTSDKVVVANRSKLIDGYLGGTAIKTQKLIKEAKGGVLFIDEAYSLGSVNGEDSFAKECIDTLNEYLSKYNNDLICIIAGYKDALDRFFFKQNEGLESRFPWRFTINAYSPEELYEIFIRQAVINGWKINIDKNTIVDELKKSMKYFNGNGRDTVNLFKSCQLCHSRRLFLQFNKKIKDPIQITKEINNVDFSNGFKLFIKNKKTNESKEPKEHNFMYV